MASIHTPKARLSYPNLFSPQPGQNPGDKPKYGAAFIFEKGTNLDEMKAAALAVLTEKHGDKAADMVRAGQLHWPFRTDAKDGYPEGCTWMNIKSVQKPDVVGPKRDPMTEPELYAGCYVRAAVGPFYFDRGTKKGVTFGLNSVQKMGEGDRLDGRKAAVDEFDDVEDSGELASAPSSMADLGL